MRAFIAVELPELFTDEIAGLCRSLARRVDGRFMARRTYHVTLAFLGDIDERTCELAMSALEETCAGVGPLPLRVTGLGTFGRPSDCTLWLGLDGQACAAQDGGYEAGEREPFNLSLNSLAARVREALALRGVDFDEKAFRPHITLARRARIPKGTDFSSLPFPLPSEATRVTLFKSTLTREGAEYKPLLTLELG